MRYLFRRRYHAMTLDDYLKAEGEMFRLGFLTSCYPPDYGKATCLNCRAIVNIGTEHTWREYGADHRRVCGYQNLRSTVQDHLRTAGGAH